MDNLLIGLGLILFVVGIVMLIVSFVKKTKKKTALLLVLIGFVVWIIGGTFVETEPLAEPVEEDIETQQNTITESSDSNSESDILNDYQNTENAAELQSAENSLDNAELFSDNFDEFYDNVSSLTTANIDDYVNNALNKKVVWTGKVIDVYDNYAYIECKDSFEATSDIGTHCHVYTQTDALKSLKKDEYITVTGLFSGSDSRSYSGCSWEIKNSVITPASN